MSLSILTSLTPRLPGLPPLAFNALTLFSGEIRLLDKISPLNLLFSTPQAVWGLFNEDGSELVTPDSVLSFDYKNDWNVSNFPQEKGAFNSYNKVNNPYDVRIRMTKGGTEAERKEFLVTIQQAGDSLDLYSVVTPEVTYLRANIIHIDYRREQSAGAGLITVDIWLTEIRSADSITKFTLTQSEGGGSLFQSISGAVKNAIGGGISFLKNTVKSIGSTAKVSLGQVQAIPATVKQISQLI